MDNLQKVRTGLYRGCPFELVNVTPSFYILRTMDGGELVVFKDDASVIFDKIPDTNEPTAITWEEAIWRYADGRDVFCVLGKYKYDLLYLAENKSRFKEALEDGEWFLEERE